MTALDNISPEKVARFEALRARQEQGEDLPPEELQELIAIVQELRRTTSGPAKPKSQKAKAAQIPLADL